MTLATVGFAGDMGRIDQDAQKKQSNWHSRGEFLLSQNNCFGARI